jgi:hypothetical protein
MSLLAITTLVLGNVFWALACLSLLLTESQVNALVGWMGFEIGVSPVAYLPLFLILALGSQIILFYVVSKLSAKKKALAEKVRLAHSENRELTEESEGKDVTLKNQTKTLEKTQQELQKMRDEHPKEPWWKNVLPK